MIFLVFLLSPETESQFKTGARVSKNKLAAVIFDMDGTLADCRHRLHYVSSSKKDWEKFFDRASEDRPRPEIVRLCLELARNNAILIASGRPEKLRKVTERWLKEYEIPFEAIYLRSNNDRRPDGTVKAEMLALIKENGFDPWLVIDDRDSAVDSWRKLGLVCLQCDEGRY